MKVADVTKLTVVSGGEGKANVDTQQTGAWASQVVFAFQMQKSSCSTREGAGVVLRDRDRRDGHGQDRRDVQGQEGCSGTGGMVRV